MHKRFMSGFTLIEVIVSSAVVALVAGLAMALMIAGTRMYQNATGQVSPWFSNSYGTATSTSDQVITQDLNLTFSKMQKDIRSACGTQVDAATHTWLTITPPVINTSNTMTPRLNQLVQLATGQYVVNSSTNVSSPNNLYIHYFLGYKNVSPPTANAKGDTIFYAVCQGTGFNSQTQGTQFTGSTVEQVYPLISGVDYPGQTPYVGDIFQNGRNSQTGADNDQHKVWVTLVVPTVLNTLTKQTSGSVTASMQFYAFNVPNATPQQQY